MWSKIISSLVAFTTFTACTVVVAQLEISNSSIKTLILSKILVTNTHKHQIQRRFLILYVPAVLTLLAYIIYCLAPNNQFLGLREGQVIFSSIYSSFLGLLTIASAYTLYQLKVSISQAQGIEISKQHQILNLVCVTTLFITSVAYAICWAKMNHLLAINIL